MVGDRAFFEVCSISRRLVPFHGLVDRACRIETRSTCPTDWLTEHAMETRGTCLKKKTLARLPPHQSALRLFNDLSFLLYFFIDKNNRRARKKPECPTCKTSFDCDKPPKSLLSKLYFAFDGDDAENEWVRILHRLITYSRTIKRGL